MARRKRRRIKSRFWVIVFVLVALISAACGFFYCIGDSDKDVLDTNKNKTISIVDECIEGQRTLDNILLKQSNWQLVERAHGNREITIPETGAVVKTNERLIGVGVPEDLTPEAACVWLKKKLIGTGLVYMGGESALYKDQYEGYRCQVGVPVKAGKGQRNFVSDTIHFYNNLNLGKTPEQLAKAPQQTRHFYGKLAIVVDDCGTDIKSVRTLLNMDVPFSFSILPGKDFSSDILAAVREKGKVALLHLPMEPTNRNAMSEGSNTIMSDMSDHQTAEMTRKFVKGLYGIVGVNNHQGSKVTADRKQMKVILQVLKEEGMFFLDSKTNSETVARDVAREMGVKTCMNDKFLDNSTSPEAIRDEMYKVLEMAEVNGSAIAICHARPGTVAMWLKYLQEFKDTGITFVPVNELLY